MDPTSRNDAIASDALGWARDAAQQARSHGIALGERRFAELWAETAIIAGVPRDEVEERLRSLPAAGPNHPGEWQLPDIPEFVRGAPRFRQQLSLLPPYTQSAAHLSGDEQASIEYAVSPYHRVTAYSELMMATGSLHLACGVGHIAETQYPPNTGWGFGDGRRVLSDWSLEVHWPATGGWTAVDVKGSFTAGRDGDAAPPTLLYPPPDAGAVVGVIGDVTLVVDGGDGAYVGTGSRRFIESAASQDQTIVNFANDFSVGARTWLKTEEKLTVFLEGQLYSLVSGVSTEGVTKFAAARFSDRPLDVIGWTEEWDNHLGPILLNRLDLTFTAYP